ncbi:hypothetical protein [Spiroplasma ixodetis]|uniref:hypothetical protein n=1 Tax=Spiroplasma ixodetis TaxID=2141 RepID=UPI002578B790|nr:hypothetical protein [Spiroplasma ixodetis]WJG69401.1 hypothetical protein SIXOD_v1c02610 [Spiroplasma ixodetis Y32]
MQCNWTEKDVTIICNNLPLIKDEKNINERYFCEMHLKQIKETRKLMHKNCINKEKLIIWLNKEIRTCLCDELKEVGKLTAYYKIVEFIENG